MPLYLASPCTPAAAAAKLVAGVRASPHTRHLLRVPNHPAVRIPSAPYSSPVSIQSSLTVSLLAHFTSLVRSLLLAEPPHLPVVVVFGPGAWAGSGHGRGGGWRVDGASIQRWVSCLCTLFGFVWDSFLYIL